MKMKALLIRKKRNLQGPGNWKSLVMKKKVLARILSAIRMLKRKQEKE